MSIWPAHIGPSLEGADGELVSLSITVEPRLLEKLLDVLARLEFPINPQLYHDAATITPCADGKRVLQPVAIVEFPAWAGRLAPVREALAAAGFGAGCLSARGMLEEIRSNAVEEPAPPGAPYKAIVRSKHGLPATA
jgi:hypothetical protein